MLGATFLHYRIIRRLGAGGMGEVWLAEDERLERRVALKVLPVQSASDDQARRRFLLEARAAAKLEHPNICTIFEVGENEGRQFIAMQYVEGRTLSDPELRQGLDLHTTIRIMRQVADALAAAHESGLIHRDVKPSNVMLTESGQAKVLDFGLAKFVAEPANLDRATGPLSQTGTILGTAAYMSPEQARGEELDARTDIFSFGVLLYEMLSGKQPFARASHAETLASILNEEPPPLSQLSVQLPDRLQDILDRCLAKDKRRRYKTMREVEAELRALQEDQGAPGQRPTRHTGATTQKTSRRTALIVALSAALVAAVSFIGWRWSQPAPIDSIAVLPITLMGNAPDMDYVSDGITVNLINSLAELQLPNLTVKSSNAAFYFKGKDISIQKAGEMLGVRTVLHGDARMNGDEWLINLELINTADNSHIWGKTFKRMTRDLAALQNDIVPEVVANLRLKLSPSEKSNLPLAATQNGEAYKAYLKGIYFQQQLEFTKSIEFLKEAIQRDPQFAEAYSALALSLLQTAVDSEAPKSIMPSVKAFALQATTLKPRMADPHIILGTVALLYEWDWETAQRELSDGSAARPEVLEVFSCTAHMLESSGRTGEAEETLRAALKADPVSITLLGELGCTSYYARHFEQSIKESREALQFQDRNLYVYFQLGRALGQKKEYAPALEELGKVQAFLGTTPPIILSEIGYINGKMGKRIEAERVLRQLNEASKTVYVDPYWFSMVYLGLSDNDRALEYLDKAVGDRSINIPSIPAEPKWDGLRQDERFKKAVHALGFKA